MCSWVALPPVTRAEMAPVRPAAMQRVRHSISQAFRDGRMSRRNHTLISPRPFPSISHGQSDGASTSRRHIPASSSLAADRPAFTPSCGVAILPRMASGLEGCLSSPAVCRRLVNGEPSENPRNPLPSPARWPIVPGYHSSRGRLDEMRG